MWTNSSTTDDSVEAFVKNLAYSGCPAEPGYCLGSEGQRQVSGALKLAEVSGSQAQECLEACRGNGAALGCEAIASGSDKGCYVHTAPVAYGSGASGATCWVLQQCRGPGQDVTEGLVMELAGEDFAGGDTWAPRVLAPAGTQVGTSFTCTKEPAWGMCGLKHEVANTPQGKCAGECQRYQGFACTGFGYANSTCHLYANSSDCGETGAFEWYTCEIVTGPPAAGLLPPCCPLPLYSDAWEG